MTVPSPRPLLVSAAGHACVAWWHAPAPQAGAPALAVVLASAWGEEDLSGYDGQRALAQALAEAGLGALRFEWPDTGDSSAPTGGASAADLLAAFDAAADRARVLSGAGRLAFVGLRLGALLAAHAAAGRGDVDALVGLLPVAGGRAFVREQRMLGAAYESGRADGAAGGVMLGGFELPGGVAEGLAALQWPTAVAGGWSEALLLTPHEAPARQAAEALARAGVRVAESAHRDLDRLLAIAHEAGLAPTAMAEVVHWLRERAAAVAGRPAPVPERAAATAREDDRPGGWMTLQAAGGAVRERIVELAPRAPADTPLAGVVGERVPGDAVVAPGARRGIVLLSSGRERRIGPHRMWVPFARERAARGDVVLRLDIGGVGDSAPHRGPAPDGAPMLYDPRCVDDVARAVEHLRREHGVGPCTVMGVCSGAYHAWRAALAGVDVQHVVALNPVLFHWRAGMSLEPQANAFGQIAIVEGAGRSLLDPARWWKLLSGRANVGIIAGALLARARRALRLRARELGRLLRLRLADDLAAELAQASRRGVALDFVFSVHEPGLTLLREEAGRGAVMLERDKRLQVCEVAHADHTFAGTRGRAGLYARLDHLLMPVCPMPTAPSVPLPRQPAAAQP